MKSKIASNPIESVVFVSLTLLVTVSCGRAVDSAEKPDSSVATAKLAPAPGPPGERVLSLDGRTAYMRVPDSPSFHSLSNAMTLEVWFKAFSFYPRDGAVNSLVRKNVVAGNENFFLRFRIIEGKPAIEWCTGNPMATLRAPYEFEPGRWYHLAGTFDGGVLNALVNGISVKAQPSSALMQIDESELIIGKGDPEYSMGEYFHGVLGEIRIWNVARSADQIRKFISTPLSGKEPGLIACWTFADGTGKDVSGHGNDGILGGEARVIGAATAIAPGSKEPISPVKQ